MTFMFDLDVPGLTDDAGRAAAAECAALGTWPVLFLPGRVERRWFGLTKAYPSVLELPASDERGMVLHTSAQRDASTVDLRVDAVEPVAAALGVIARHFPDGFVFRATWTGSPIQQDDTVSITALESRIRQGQLNEFTRYTVPGRLHPA